MGWGARFYNIFARAMFGSCVNVFGLGFINGMLFNGFLK